MGSMNSERDEVK